MLFPCWEEAVLAWQKFLHGIVWYLHALNALLCAFCDVVLIASDPPNVDVSPTTFVVNQTQRATFTCRVFGIPIPELTWYNTSDLTIDYLPPEMAEVTQQVFVNGSGLDIIVSVLRFNRSLRTDQTTYTCVAVNNISNLLGTPEMGSANFYVQGFSLLKLTSQFFLLCIPFSPPLSPLSLSLSLSLFLHALLLYMLLTSC